MGKRVWVIAITISSLLLIIIIGLQNIQSVYSKSDCENSDIPCVNAISDIDAVKVMNGTSTFEFDDGRTIFGDVFEEDIKKKATNLEVKRDGEVELDFINHQPTSLSVYLLDGNERSTDIKVDSRQYSFIAPKKKGLFQYEIYAEYPNATVYHYLKITVR